MEKQVNKTTVQRLLIHLGIAPKTNGYSYLTTAVLMMLQKRPHHLYMFEVYDRIAQERKVSPSSVERCMRFSISRAYDANKLEALNEIFNANIITQTPMLSDFIMYIVEYFDSFYRDDDDYKFC